MFEVNPLALPSFVLGYHGCTHDLAEAVLAGEVDPSPSKNAYDWLGHGVYFWEHNPQRALEWARERRFKSPAVIGAIINLGKCFNLLDSSNLAVVELAYHDYKETVKKEGAPLPRNRNAPKDSNADLLFRVLDCEIINHAMRLAERENKSFDTVRGVFMEGEELYPTAGFRRKNHIQICVRNTKIIAGYFRVKFPTEKNLV